MSARDPPPPLSASPLETEAEPFESATAGSTEHAFPTPPSSAASSSTITTNDEDATRCEEWELFSDSDGGGSRPSSEPRERVSGSSLSRTWTARSAPSGGVDGADPGDDEADVSTDRGDDDPRLDLRSPRGLDLEDPQSLVVSAAVASSARTDHSRPSTARSTTSSICSSAAGTSILPADEPAATSSRMQVFVRIRPPHRAESQTDAVCLGDRANSLRVQSTSAGSVSESAVDRVFAESSTQEQVFCAIEPGIRAALEGVNATIFAYGQTGTGKTYTMFGDGFGSENGSISSPTPATWGLIPRVLSELCSKSYAAAHDKGHIQLTGSFLQIYNDRVFDLLTDRKRQKPLVLREQPTADGGTNVVLQGLSSEPLRDVSEALRLLEKGRVNRSVRETELNSSSSRSHAIVQINISIETPLANGDKRIRSSRLNLVDLAGSEKWNTELDMEDHHAVELKNINTSLSALGNCIAALAEAGRRHIPYRDSTLTRLLQDSFGGNTLAFLIATISPSQRASEETIRTLQFADRARSVMQVVRVNESFSGSSELLAAKAQIQSLRAKLAQEQRRRQETRLKEHDALLKEFSAKLQAKDEEVKRVTRDNQVFAKWRDEDVKRIRELEARVREMASEGVAPTSKLASAIADWGDQNKNNKPVVDRADDRNNQQLEDSRESIPRHQQFHTEAAGKELTRKRSKRAMSHREQSIGQQATGAKELKPRVKSYRFLIDKYALQPQKGSHARQQPEASRAPQNNISSNTQEMGSNAATSMRAAATIHALASPEKKSQLARATSDSGFVSASNKVSLAPGETSGYSTLSSSEYSKTDPSRSVAPAQLSKTESLPTLVAVRQDSWNVPSSTLLPVSGSGNNSGVGDHSGKLAAWQLPPMPVNTPASDRGSYEPPVVSSSLGACAKHSLRGCVLCAVNDYRPQVANYTVNMAAVTSSSAQKSAYTAPAAHTTESQQPCMRHHLPSCFICAKPAVESSWSPTLSIPAVPIYCPTSSSSAAANSSTQRPSPDTKCSAHTLANCVLCAGVSHTRLAAGESLSSSSPIKRSLAEASWRAASIDAISGSSGSYPSYSYSSQPYKAAPEFRAPNQMPLPTYHPRVDVELTCNNVPGDTQSQSCSPTVRRSVKELSTDNNSSRRQFQSLVRDASDAATIVLRRRA